MLRLSVLLLALVFFGCGDRADQQPGERPPEEAAVEPDIRGEEVAYESDGVSLHGYMAYDANRLGERPGVLIVHE